MDVTPKSKQPGHLNRRPLGLSRTSRTKLIQSEEPTLSQEKLEMFEGTEDASIGTSTGKSEQHCTPVRQTSLKNSMSPQYPHMFRIYHDESPEFRVGWDDGISEDVPRKEKSYFDSSIQNRTNISQRMRRSWKRIPTPPRLKQPIMTADVLEYMQWAKNLVAKAQTPSPSETPTANTTLEKETNDSSCDNSKEAECLKETVPMGRRSLPVSVSSMKENMELDRKSLPSKSNYANFFDDSTNDDLFMKCSQAVEDSLLKDKHSVTKAAKSINNNTLSRNKDPQLAMKIVSRPIVSAGQFQPEAKPSFLAPNQVLIKKSASQQGAIKLNNGGGGAVTGIAKTLSSGVASSNPIALHNNPSKLSGGKNLLSKREPSASGDTRTDIQLLDEDDDFLSSVDLQSLSQLDPPRSAITSSASTKRDHSTSNAQSSVSVNLSSLNERAAQFNISAPDSRSHLNPATISTNVSNHIVNPVNQTAAKSGKFCSQDVIKRKREEAQRRLKSKMMRYSS